MPASRPSRTEFGRAPAPIRSQHSPIPPGAKAGKRRAIGPGPKQLVGPVVSAFAPVDRLRFGHPASRSGRLQDAERYHGSAHVLTTPRCRGHMLAHAGPAGQELSELVVAAAIPPRRSSALQSKHRSTSALDAAVILLKSVAQIATCPMPHMAAELGPDCPGIGIVAVRGDPIRGYASHRLCPSKEGLGGGEVAVLTQHHVDQGAGAIDCAIQIPPTTTHPNGCLVDVPASADFAFSEPTQVLSQCWDKFGFPITDGLIAEDEPADQEHFGQIPQAELVAKPPQHHESNDITRVLGSVQEAGAALIELLAALTTAEPAIALRRPFRPTPDRR